MRRVLICILFTSVGLLLPVSLIQSQELLEDTAASANFSKQEQAARDKVLNSDRWQDARAKFSQWLLVQTVYDVEQQAELEKKLNERIANMDAKQLEAFLAEMEERLDILLSPEVSEARDQISRYLTDSAQKRLLDKYGLENPMSLSPAQIQRALQRFQGDLDSERLSRAAFNQARQSQVDATQAFRKQQDKALQSARKEAASMTPTPRFSSSYAPRRPQQTYRAAYPKLHYSIGPWGGVWIGR